MTLSYPITRFITVWCITFIVLTKGVRVIKINTEGKKKIASPRKTDDDNLVSRLSKYTCTSLDGPNCPYLTGVEDPPETPIGSTENHIGDTDAGNIPEIDDQEVSEIPLPSCEVGDDVTAIWPGNGQMYKASIVKIDDPKPGVYTLNWADGDPSFRNVKSANVFKNGQACGRETGEDDGSFISIDFNANALEGNAQEMQKKIIQRILKKLDKKVDGDNNIALEDIQTFTIGADGDMQQVDAQKLHQLLQNAAKKKQTKSKDEDSVDND